MRLPKLTTAHREALEQTERDIAGRFGVHVSDYDWTFKPGLLDGWVECTAMAGDYMFTYTMYDAHSGTLVAHELVKVYDDAEESDD